MSLGFLLDEQIPKWWRREINVRQPKVAVWRVGDPGAAPLQASDLEILKWCEANTFVLVTNNRKTMAGELNRHVAQGGHVPGIFMVDPGANVRELAEDLSLIEGASFPNEFQDQIRYLPLG